MVFRLFSVSLIFIFQSLLSKIVSLEEYGIYAKFNTYSGYISLLLSFGLTSSILYFSKTDSEFKINYTSALLFYIVIGLFSYLFTFLFFENTLYQLIIIYSLVINIISISLCYYQFKQQFKLFGFLSFMQSAFIISVLLINFFLEQTSIYRFLQLFILFQIIYSFFLIFLTYKNDMILISNKLYVKMTHINYGIKAVSLMMLAQIIYIADFFVVDYFLGSEFLSLYFVAIIFSKILLVIADTFANIIYALYTQKLGIQKKEIDINMYNASSLIFVFSLLAALLFAIFGKFFIELFFDVRYLKSFSSTLILIMSTHGIIIYKFLSRKNTSENKWKILYISVSICAVLNLILNFVLVPKFGITGAASASFISYWTCGILLLKLNHESLKNFLFNFNYNG